MLRFSLSPKSVWLTILAPNHCYMINATHQKILEICVFDLTICKTTKLKIFYPPKCFYIISWCLLAFLHNLKNYWHTQRSLRNHPDFTQTSLRDHSEITQRKPRDNWEDIQRTLTHLTLGAYLHPQEAIFVVVVVQQSWQTDSAAATWVNRNLEFSSEQP